MIHTETQFALLWGWSRGMTNKELASRLGITVHGVVSAAQRLYRHLGAVSQAHAVAIAYQEGLLDARRGRCASDMAALHLLKNWAVHKEEA